MSNRALAFGSLLLAYNAIDTLAMDAGLNIDLGGGFSGGGGGNVDAGAGGGLGLGMNIGGDGGLGVNVGGEGAHVGVGGADANVDAGGNGAGVSVEVGGSGDSSGSASVNADGGASGNVHGGLSAGVSANIAWPDLQVGVIPGGDDDAPVYTPAASIWSSSSDPNKPEHTGEHRIASGVFFTASATHDVPPPQYTIQGGPAKVICFPPGVGGGDAGGKAPAPGITPAPTDSPAGLGADGLCTTLGTVLDPQYVYISFSTLFAGCKDGDKMKTIGPTYANTMFSFHSDAISTRCASSTAPDAAPTYGPPAAINWDDINGSKADGSSNCLNIAPPADFLKSCPPEWTQQLYWNIQFQPPQVLMQDNSEKGKSAATDCTSCSNDEAGATGAVYRGTNGSASGIAGAPPYSGASSVQHGHESYAGWRMVAMGMFVGVLTTAALL